MNVCLLSLGLLQSGSTNARAGETNVNVNLLQQYLEGSPWIRKIVFRWPRNRTRFFIQSKNISGRVQGWARFEAALQPGGWYIKHLEGSPQYDVFGRDGVPRLGAPPRGAQEFVGANSDYYWECGPGRPDLASMGLGPGNDLLRLIPREGRPGYSPTNYGLFRMHYERTNYLESVRLWGFYWLYLLKMKVAWTGRDTFVARAPDGSFAEGSVTHWADEQRPARWECIVRPADREPWSFRVEYEHDRSRSFPPARFIMGGAAVAGEPIRFVFAIDEFEPGLDQRYAEGYEPEMFRSVHAPYKTLRIDSNGILYSVDYQGNWKPLNLGAPTLPMQPQGPAGVSKGRRWTWTVLVLAGAAGFWVAIASLRKRIRM